MATPLIPQEIYLLERYTSKAYFSDMRDDWERMVQHAERCLDAFTHKLPHDYRSRPLFDQPDIVWGERILPNFRATLDALNRAYISLTHGDMQALGAAGRIGSDFAGFTRDYSADWMDEPQITSQADGGSDQFWHWLTNALCRASNIEYTVRAHWIMTALSSRYDDDGRGALDPPDAWPRYALDPIVRATTGKPVATTGIYLPLIADSCPAFMLEGEPAPPASVGYDQETMQNVSEAACEWARVVPVPGAFVADGLADLQGGDSSTKPHRHQAGERCSRAGWWYTPARAASRRYFKQDDIFPTIGDSDYGDTFWLWSDDQSMPRLG